MTDNPASDSGGASSALDLTTEADRGMVRKAMERWPKRWRGLTEEKKEGFVADLDKARATASKLLDSGDPEVAMEAAKVMSSVVKTAVQMEAQIQADDHVEDKNRRLDEGKATERILPPVVQIITPMTYEDTAG